MPETYVDIGLNLGHRRFDRDREEVLDRALAAGVTRMILTGTDVAESEAMASLAAGRPGTLWSTAGVHPHDASGCDDETLPALRRLAQRSPVVAIGECGLDFNRDYSPRPAQEAWLQRQIELACELSLPLFLHERDATERMVAILDSFGADLPPGVVHCFTGDADALAAYLERGRDPLKALVGRVPLERLLVETDAPFLTPRDLRPRPKRNEPALLPHIAAVVASCRGCSLADVASATTHNAERLFGLDRERRHDRDKV